MQSLSNFLKFVRTVIELHETALVRDNGVQVRDSIIDALATSTELGHAIIYYATAPVSLTLAIKLQGAMEDRSILQQVAIGANYDADEAQNMEHGKHHIWPRINEIPIQNSCWSRLQNSPAMILIWTGSWPEIGR